MRLWGTCGGSTSLTTFTICIHQIMLRRVTLALLVSAFSYALVSHRWINNYLSAEFALFSYDILTMLHTTASAVSY